MKVVFVQYGGDITCATMMVASCRRLGYEVWQLSDMTAPDVPGVDRIDREPMSGPRNLWRYKRLSQLKEPYVSLDTDMIVAKDISDGFGGDVSLSWRYPNDVIVGDEIVHMPYNAGLVMVRNQEFIRECYRAMQDMDDAQSDWWGDQIALRDVAASGKYEVRELKEQSWNYSPDKPMQGIDRARIFHFKGNRKHLMPAYFEAVCAS